MDTLQQTELNIVHDILIIKPKDRNAYQWDFLFNWGLKNITISDSHAQYFENLLEKFHENPATEIISETIMTKNDTGSITSTITEQK